MTSSPLSLILPILFLCRPYRLSVFAACADRLTDIDFCSVGKRNYKVAFFRKCCGADIGFVFFRHCGKCFAPILFTARISVIDGNLICRFTLERNKPIIKASRISLLHRKLVCGQAVLTLDACTLFCCAQICDCERYGCHYSYQQYRHNHFDCRFTF